MEKPVPAFSIIAACCLLLAGTMAYADKPAVLPVTSPADYEANYIVEKYDTQVARLSYRLQHLNKQIIFTTQAEVTGFAALFRNDSAAERSVLMNASPPRLLSYQYQQNGGKKNRNTRLTVDWQGDSGSIQGEYAGAPFTKTVHGAVWDPLSVQLALMRDMATKSPPFRYQVIHHGELKQYAFEQLADDTLEIDEVFYDAVVLQRKNNNRLTRFWLAKDYQYIPLQIENYKNGELDTRIVLDSLNLHE